MLPQPVLNECLLAQPEDAEARDEAGDEVGVLVRAGVTAGSGVAVGCGVAFGADGCGVGDGEGVRVGAGTVGDGTEAGTVPAPAGAGGLTIR